MTRHRRRVEHLIRDELSELLRHEVKDPRLNGLITVTEVSISPDLKKAKVFISIMAADDEEALQGLRSASGFLQRALGKRVSLRHVPELSFAKDNSIERGVRLSQLIGQLSAEDVRPEQS